MARTVDHAARESRRRDILDTALGMFAERGYDVTPVADIAAAVGVSSGTVFHHFGSKDALFRAAFEGDGPRNRDLVARAVADPDPVSALLGLVDGVAADVTNPIAAGLVVELVRRLSADPELARIVDEVDGIVRDGLTAVITRVVEDGRADPGVDAATAAGWIMSMIDGAHLGSAELEKTPELLRLTVVRFLRISDRNPS